MNKFIGTPYPWKWFTSNSHNRLSSEVTGKDGDVIHAFRASDGMVCVNVNQRDMAVIATAPELLEALQDALHAHDKHGEHSEWDFAREVIAKALGQ